MEEITLSCLETNKKRLEELSMMEWCLECTIEDDVDGAILSDTMGNELINYYYFNDEDRCDLFKKIKELDKEASNYHYSYTIKYEPK